MRSRKRKEIAAAVPSYLPAVPQLYADVDREKASQQQVDLNNVYTTMQTFMGGYLVNYFNRFGRQWQTYVEAEGRFAHARSTTSTSFMCAAPMEARCRWRRWCM